MYLLSMLKSSDLVIAHEVFQCFRYAEQLTHGVPSVSPCTCI